jgi:hypothetical protein
LLPADADAVLNEILATHDVGEIFVRAFRWAVRSTGYVMQRHGIVSGTARESFWLDNSRDEIAGVFRNAALPRMRSHPDPAQRTVLPDDLAQWLRRELRRLLVRAEDDHVFPVVLALMDAIDRQLYELLQEDFYSTEGRDGVHAAPVRPDRPFPKPIPALGVRDLAWQHRQSERAELPEYLEMEQYFGRLSVSARREAGLPRALHVRSEPGDGARPWRVALVSVLSSADDLDWQKPDGPCDRRFWAAGFRSPETREVIRARLIRAMDLCREHRADLILIPELNTDAEIHETLVQQLRERPAGPGRLHPMVLAGCLHEPVEGEPRAFRNRPAVLTRDGQVPWGYYKVAAAEWDERREALCERPPEVMAIDTPMGRIAVVICMDFITPPVVEAVTDLRASVVVVLSMTSAKSVNLFDSKAAELAAGAHAVTLFCNSSVLLRGHRHTARAPRTLGFAYPHTAGSPRPLCAHRLRDVRAGATVAVYELEYSSTHGLAGRIVEEKTLPRGRAAGLVLRSPVQIVGEGAPAPAQVSPALGSQELAAD